MTPDIQILRERLRYQPDDGKLFWLPRGPESFSGQATRHASRWASLFEGREALCSLDADGYLRGLVGRRAIKAHRAAWALYYGNLPEEIDHINGERTDNRICNLRAVSRSQNCRNRAVATPVSGVVGVYASPTKGKWCAFINSTTGRRTHLGTFHTKADAVAARRAAEIENGYSARHGSTPCKP